MKESKARNGGGLVKPSNPNEIHGISYDYCCNVEIVEKALAGLPMKVARQIDYSTFTKLADRPFGHSRYNVYDTIDSFLGYIEIEKLADSAAIVTFVCPINFKATFEKIKSALDKQIAADIELSKIVTGRMDITPAKSIEKPEKPAKPSKDSEINVWFDWYHAMHENKSKCTLEEIANETSHSPGYIRQLHARYVHERGLAKPNNKTNRKTNKN